MTAKTALIGARIALEQEVVTGCAIVIEDDRIAAICPVEALPPVQARIDLGGGVILPGFIDTQVNGGGGTLFNDSPSVAGIRAIAQAHRRFGTTGLLPTLISDDLSVVATAMDAIDEAIEQGVPGVLGIHIEGPFLNIAKRGIHDGTKLQRMGDAAFTLLTRPGRGVRLVTLAPEMTPPGMIRALVDAGVIVAAGHSMADYDQTRAALAEGLSGFTHLFNAMTPLASREPGMVGAALDGGNSHFGLIVDGHHVHPATLRIALASVDPARAVLVTDAMPPVGTALDHFALMGTEVRLVEGQLRSADGTLAGSALTMAQAVRNAQDLLGMTLVRSSAMASGNPARFLGLDGRTGIIAPGQRADLVHLDDARAVTATWIGGVIELASE